MASSEVVLMLVRRCAWCDRVFTANGWQSQSQPRRHAAAERETATICPDCTDQLQGLGLSR